MKERRKEYMLVLLAVLFTDSFPRKESVSLAIFYSYCCCLLLSLPLGVVIDTYRSVLPSFIPSINVKNRYP